MNSFFFVCVCVCVWFDILSSSNVEEPIEVKRIEARGHQGGTGIKAKGIAEGFVKRIR